MLVTIKFKNGMVWENVRSLYICDFKHYCEYEGAYHILAQSVIEKSFVTAENFQLAQQEAKQFATVGEADIGRVLGCSQPVKKCEMTPKKKGPVWKEVSSD
jgi:hypothetical protein